MQPARKRELAGAFDGFQQLPRVLLAKDARLRVRAEIECGKLAQLQLKDIQRLLHKAALHKFVRNDSAKRVEVERAALREILEAAGLLSGALRILANPNRKLRISSHGTSASRTAAANMRQEVKRLGIGRALLRNDAYHRGNYLAGFLNDDRISNADILAANFILVMQRGAGDRASAKKNRLELRDGSEHARAADLNCNIAQPRCCLLRRVFPGPRPFRRARVIADTLAQLNVVELDHGAVCLDYVMFCQEEEVIFEQFDLVMDKLVDGWRLYGYADSKQLAESLLHECKHY